MPHHHLEGLNDTQVLHALYFLECVEHWRDHGFPEPLVLAVAARDAAERHPLGVEERAAVRRYLELRAAGPVRVTA